MVDLHTFKHPSVAVINGDHWFSEMNADSFPGQAFSLKIKRILHHAQSEFQDILIFESETFGNVLVLNGIVQCTEKDEFVYQELISHVPLMSHPAPKNVLVIGGGDCGVVREVAKHIKLGFVDNVTMVEIDDMVINLSRKYLPNMALPELFENEKVNFVIDDGFKFLKENTNKYDVIITDSSDPEGPAEEFFQTNYFRLLQSSLTPGGIVIMQSSENIWLNLDYLKQLKNKAETVFKNVKYTQCYMPSYTSGQLGLLVATDDEEKDLTRPLRTADNERELFRYYGAKIHESSFVLPTWVASELSQK
ncbi:Spermine synthase [Yamadazyma tenuis]|uniref:Spermine synthase n=1 Tax=Candida tenuis (strain ATCC 10573 / BCRC 21748 / CBS 615 / JCM 9827 / NBRC 10315 / NRRL Y-1498 / VKM Y-70) TaxID=590646 RepID=G3AXL9_CANTC|nr:spermine synthase [Yamadazyma tenuis ATCC 10573]EGV65646.1 spermine synthase [Yamadazyma tenuis ATCC 10573]WEJ96043.1 Spermine synthase [Yamadazyma tenuis]